MATKTATQGRQMIRVGSYLVAPEDLVSASDIATMLGVALISAQRYTLRDEFPEPLGQAAGGRVWRRQDVEKWAKRTLPLRAGRPPKERS